MLGGWLHCWSFFFSGHLAEKHGFSACCEQWGCLLYVCMGSSTVTIVVDCLRKLGGGGNQATGQVTSHLLLTPILIVLVTCMVSAVVLVTCHWVVPLGCVCCLPLVLVACHWVAYRHFWSLVVACRHFWSLVVTCRHFWLLVVTCRHLWSLADTPGCLWVLVDTSGRLQTLLVACGCL